MSAPHDPWLSVSDDLAIAHFRCPGIDDPTAPFEQTDGHRVVLVQRGHFVKQVGRRETIADPTRAVFFDPDEPYRIRHPIPGGDECTSIGISNRLRERLLAGAGLAPNETRPPVAGIPVSASAALSLREFGQDQSAVRRSDDLQEHLLGLLEDVFAAAFEARHAKPTWTSGRNREIARELAIEIARDYRSHRSLEELAAGYGVSVFHLCRIYKANHGTTIHRHRLRLRLHSALEALEAGCGDIAQLALELGFTSHSHFSESFRRTFGTTPSRVRFSGRRRAGS